MATKTAEKAKTTDFPAIPGDAAGVIRLIAKTLGMDLKHDPVEEKLATVRRSDSTCQEIPLNVFGRTIVTVRAHALKGFVHVELLGRCDRARFRLDPRAPQKAGPFWNALQQVALDFGAAIAAQNDLRIRERQMLKTLTTILRPKQRQIGLAPIETLSGVRSGRIDYPCICVLKGGPSRFSHRHSTDIRITLCTNGTFGLIVNATLMSSDFGGFMPTHWGVPPIKKDVKGRPITTSRAILESVRRAVDVLTRMHVSKKLTLGDVTVFTDLSETELVTLVGLLTAPEMLLRDYRSHLVKGRIAGADNDIDVIRGIAYRNDLVVK